MRPPRDDAEVTQDVLRVRPGAPLLREPLELALDERPIQVEEVEPVRLDPALLYLLDQRE
jgi:hypothetical protein